MKSILRHLWGYYLAKKRIREFRKFVVDLSKILPKEVIDDFLDLINLIRVYSRIGKLNLDKRDNDILQEINHRLKDIRMLYNLYLKEE